MPANTNKDWPKLQEFQNEHKDLLIMIADPRTDEVSISFNRQFAFVRFPMEDMASGIVFNALRESKFAKTIDAFMTGVIESSGIDTKNKSGNELLKLLGGAMKSLGIGAGKIKKIKQ